MSHESPIPFSETYVGDSRRTWQVEVYDYGNGASFTIRWSHCTMSATYFEGDCEPVDKKRKRRP